MDMKNKEQLLYFFLQGKISLSQYDYKFMANLQTMIQNQSRVTSNQADLFDKLISKYKKQLAKNGFDKEELKSLPWKTMMVESTSEYTGASVKLIGDDIVIRVPFNKTFIGHFRSVENSSYAWDREEKIYRSPFSTLAFKLAYEHLPKYFSSVRYCDSLQNVLNELKQYDGLVWNPTAKKVNGRIVVGASNEVLGSFLNGNDLTITPANLFTLNKMAIAVDPSLYENDEKLEFAASSSYVVDETEIEKTISWMKSLGCKNVVLGRGLRSTHWRDNITMLIQKYGMNPVGPMSFGTLPEGLSMLFQHVSSVEQRQMFSGRISKTVVIKDSRPIEVR